MDKIILIRDISVIFKITTEYFKNNLFEYFQNSDIQNEIIDYLEENIDFKIKFNKISYISTENKKKIQLR